MKRKTKTKSYGRISEHHHSVQRKDNVIYRGADRIEEDVVHYKHYKTAVPLKNGHLKRNHHSEHLDKSMHSWGAMAPLSDRKFGAGIGNDFCNGNRGMAKAVRGAKKYVRSRVRFHENQATRKMLRDGLPED
jgi:hypothetical protein